MNTQNTPIEVVIPAAGAGRRMRSFGPKALLKLENGETVIGRQIRLIRQKFPRAQFVVVGGFGHEKLLRSLPSFVRVVFNEDYETTNVAHSILLGVRSCQAPSLLIVYGDLVFNPAALKLLDLNQSSVVVENASSFRDQEVGVAVCEGQAVQFAFGLAKKWAQILMLTGRERELFEEIASEQRRVRQFGYEVLNEVLERGGELAALAPPGLELVEIDLSRDIPRAKKLK